VNRKGDRFVKRRLWYARKKKEKNKPSQEKKEGGISLTLTEREEASHALLGEKMGGIKTANAALEGRGGSFSVLLEGGGRKRSQVKWESGKTNGSFTAPEEKGSC